MKRTSSSNPAIGRRVVARDTETRRLAVDFPGWDAPNYENFLLEIPVDLGGKIVDVEQHGSNPWTRYTVEFDDGTRSVGLILGKDIKIA